MKLRGESPLPYTTGKRSQIIYTTYSAHAVPDRRVILKGENKHMPMYLGIVVFIFCLLWSGVGDSQESEDRKDPRACSAGDVSNCRVNRGTPGKREARRVMVFSTDLVVLLIFFSFYLFFLPLFILLP